MQKLNRKHSWFARLALAATFALMAGGAVLAQSVVLGFPGGIGPVDVPAIQALEALKADGWNTQVIEFDSPDILTQALLNGQVQIAPMGPSTAIAANLAGADLRIVGKTNLIDHVIITAPDVEDCSQLDGRTVAYHSTGSTTTTHLRHYLAQNCPDAEPNFIVLSGSANRVLALLNGQIAGTLVRLEDWMAITGGEDDRAKVLARLIEDQRDILTGTVVVSASHMETNEPAIRAFIAELEAQFEAIYADPAGYAREYAHHLPEMSPDELASVYVALAEGQMFPLDDPLNAEEIEATLAFYENAGIVEPGALAVEDIADFGFSGQN